MLARLNPHTHWAIASQLRDLDLHGRHTVRVWLRVRATSATASRQQIDHLVTRYPGLRLALERHATGRVHAAQLARLAEEPAVDDLEIAEPLRLERPLPRWPAGTGAARAAGHRNPGGVPALPDGPPVLGLIDTGLPFAHRGVCTGPDHAPVPRFQALWDQDPAPDFGDQGLVPQPFGHGAVLGHAAMRRALLAAGGRETPTYALAGYGELAARRTHGAHVLGLLAMGEGFVDRQLGLGRPASAPACTADLLGVQLPRALLHSPSRAALCGAVLDGLLWMQALCGQRPLRVALPYGSTLGPHDGSSLFEQALDQLIEASAGRLSVLLPSGNSQRMRLHATVDTTALGAGQALVWRVPPASEAAAQLELWWPSGHSAQVDVVAPNGQVVARSGWPGSPVQGGGRPGPALTGDPTPGASQCALGLVHTWAPAPGGGQQAVLLLRLGPTRVVDSGRVAAPPGDWTVRLHSPRADAGAGSPPAADAWVHAYASRAQGSFGAALRGRQAQLLVPAGSAWRVSEEGTLSGMATGRRAQVVGGYINAVLRGGAAHLNAAADYTASGTGRQGRAVDHSLASDQSPALGGVRSSGTRSAITWRMNGSSVAVPQAARLGLAPPPVAPSDLRLGQPHLP